MVKIMHISDLHLDSKIDELGTKKSEIRRNELKETFEKSINTAKEKNVDIVLIAGDLFDNDFTCDDTIEFLKRQFKNANEIRFFISPGNHDPYTLKAYKKLKNGLSDNVTIFENKIDYVEIKNLNTRVYGYGFYDFYVNESVIKNFCAINDEMINIFVIHGDLNSQSVYNPIIPSDLEKSNISYVALGHTHTFSGILKSQKTFYAYSGTHEPHGFDEFGKKGIIIGTVDKENVNLDFVSIAKREYKIIDIDISECEISDDIINKIKNQIDNKNDLYKINLVGYKAETLKINIDLLVSTFENEAFFVKIKDNTKPKIDILEISKEYTLKGMCAKRVIEITNEDNKQHYDKVLNYLLEMF